MTGHNEHIDELIGKVLSIEATETERAEFDSWLNSNGENRAHFESLKRIFDRIAVSETPDFDVDLAWKNVHSRIQTSGGRVITHPSSFSRRRWMGVAASLAVLITAGYFIYSSLGGTSDEMSFAAGNRVSNFQLPDGSYTTLNKDATIEYAFSERKHERVVKLKGEAMFSIQHDSVNQFVVEVNELLIKDIGTTFNVKAIEGNDTVEVFVKEGIVQMFTEENSGIELKEGESGFYIRSTKKFLRPETSDENSSAYADRIFKFKNDRLEKVIHKLNEVYETRLELSSEKLNDCRITVNFANDDIETIAQVIAETLGLSFEMKDGKIVLLGEGC